VKHIFPAIGYDGVTGVVAALEADYIIGITAYVIYYFGFGFVAPHTS
jgi:hypothetical protein